MVTLSDQSGQDLETVAETERSLTGSKAVGVPAGTYFLRVQSSGSWTIGIEKPAPVSVPFPPQSYSAGGPLATPFFQTMGGPVTVTMNYQGSGNFVVVVLESGGRAVDLAANKTGPYQGAHLVSLRSEVNYLLNVEADGPWTIDIK